MQNQKKKGLTNDSLYRYRQVNTVELEFIFKSNELFLPSPEGFNDPFDCKVSFNFENCNEGDLKKFFYACSEVVDKEGKKLFEKNFEIILKDNNKLQETMEGFKKYILKDINSLGILCLSQKPDDILMWSHYADGHRGIVLEFDKNGLEEHFKFCEEVVYHPENNFLSLKDWENNNLEELAKLLILRKSIHWKYEEEWRIIVNTNRPKGRIFKFPSKLLTGVILGCEISDKNRNQIDVLRNQMEFPIKIYEAIKDNESYDVKIKEEKETSQLLTV